MREGGPQGRFATHWVPVLAWMAVISAGTSLPGQTVMVPEGGDWFVHLGIYAVLGGLLLRAFLGAMQFGPATSALITVLWGGLYGAYDEVHQAFVGTRTCSPADLAADLAGLSLAAIIGYIITIGRKPGCEAAHTTSRRAR